MANKEISELTAGTALDGAELFHGVQDGNSRKFTSLQLLTPALSATDKAAVRAASDAPIRGHLFGLGIATGTDTVNDINVAAGEAASEQSNPLLMVYAGTTGIQLDVAYGTGSGGRFDTSISDGVWFIFLISNGTTTAAGLSKSADPTGQANYPSGYTHYRTIGHVVRASSANDIPVMYAQPDTRLVGTAPVFGCRAWVNFNGTGTVAIRGSGNVSSITDNGTGDYTINFATPMPDANYAVAVSFAPALGGFGGAARNVYIYAATTSSLRIQSRDNSAALTDFEFISVTVHR